jgi:hypothetical protein
MITSMIILEVIVIKAYVNSAVLFGVALCCSALIPRAVLPDS